MRTFSKFEKELSIELLKPIFFGEKLVNMDFIKQYFDKVAFLRIGSSLYFFYNSEEHMSQALIKLVSILSLLKDLENNGLLFCITDPNDNFIISQRVLYSCSRNISGIIGCSGMSISLNEMEIRNNMNKVLYSKGVRIEGGLESILLYYFSSSIYVSETFKYLAKHNFKSIEERSLNIARISIWSSIIIALISLGSSIFMTLYNNKHAVTEIKASQYDSVLVSFDKNNALLDSIVRIGNILEEEYKVDRVQRTSIRKDINDLKRTVKHLHNKTVQ